MLIFREIKIHPPDKKWYVDYDGENVAIIKFVKGDNIHTVDCIKIEWTNNPFLNNTQDCYCMGKIMQKVAVFAAKKHQLFDDFAYSKSIGRCSTIL
jgi:hypothetical protein